MAQLQALDLAVMALYFLVLLWIGFAVMRAEKSQGENESFLAADRDMGLFRSTASTAATDIGGVASSPR